MRFLTSGILALGVLYATIWPHELGHSVVAYLYGCKSNWWQTYMSWFLWNSWAGPVDYGCLQAAGGVAEGITDFAGVAVNLLLLCLAPVVGQWWHAPASRGSVGAWVFVGTVFWALANYAEAFSYLVLNTLWLSSDMKTVVLQSGLSRWTWCGLGLAAAVFLWRLLLGPLRSAANFLQTPRVSGRTWLVIFGVYVCALSLTMGAARIVLVPPPAAPPSRPAPRPARTTTSDMPQGYPPARVGCRLVAPLSRSQLRALRPLVRCSLS